MPHRWNVVVWKCKHKQREPLEDTYVRVLNRYLHAQDHRLVTTVTDEAESAGQETVGLRWGGGRNCENRNEYNKQFHFWIKLCLLNPQDTAHKTLCD